MLIFSNHSESFILKTASYMGAGASLLPILMWANGKVSISDSLLGVGLFLTMTIIAFILRRNRTIEVKLHGQFIEVVFPFKNKSFRIQYDQIQDVTFSDLGMSLSMRLKNGKNISLGSTIHKESGDFSVPELGPADAQGRPGERLRLKREIEARFSSGK